MITRTLLALLLAPTICLQALPAQGEGAQIETEEEVPAAIEAKLDEEIVALEDEDDRHHIFVRLKGQFFESNRAFLDFCNSLRFTSGS